MHQSQWVRRPLLRRGSHRGEVDDGGVRRSLFEQVDDPLVAGKDEHLVGAGELDKGGGGTPRALEVEVHEHLVDDDRQPFRFFTHALDEAEAERQVELLARAATELLWHLLPASGLVEHGDLLLPHRDVEL